MLLRKKYNVFNLLYLVVSAVHTNRLHLARKVWYFHRIYSEILQCPLRVLWPL